MYKLFGQFEEVFLGIGTFSLFYCYIRWNDGAFINWDAFFILILLMYSFIITMKEVTEESGFAELM